MLALLFSLFLAVASSLPAQPPEVTQMAEWKGMCGQREVTIKAYVSSEGVQHFRYLYKGEAFAVFIPPLAYVKRANGSIAVFDPAVSGEEVCESLEKALNKNI